MGVKSSRLAERQLVARRAVRELAASIALSQQSRVLLNRILDGLRGDTVQEQVVALARELCAEKGSVKGPEIERAFKARHPGRPAPNASLCMKRHENAGEFRKRGRSDGWEFCYVPEPASYLQKRAA